jgi:hypothetical protein
MRGCKLISPKTSTHRDTLGIHDLSGALVEIAVNTSCEYEGRGASMLQRSAKLKDHKSPLE